MFPVSLNPYFNPTLSSQPFINPSQPFINPEWAMRAYAHHAWDPFQAQAYYRGAYPSWMSSGIDPSQFNPATNINPINLQSQVPIGFVPQSQGGFGQQSQGGFGQQSQGGFGPQSQGGFGPQSQGGFGPQSQAPIGFTSPSMYSSPTTQFGYGSPSFFGHLSPHELGLAGQTSGNYLSPEFQEFIRSELLRTGKAIRTIATALENENEQVKTQAQVALTAQFFYTLGLLYTRGVIIPRDVPGASTRADDVTPTVAAESFGESLERFAREPSQFRSTTLGELIEKARACFRVLASEGEQLERFKEDRFKIEKKRVSA